MHSIGMALFLPRHFVVEQVNIIPVNAAENADADISTRFLGEERM